MSLLDDIQKFYDDKSTKIKKQFDPVVENVKKKFSSKNGEGNSNSNVTNDDNGNVSITTGNNSLVFQGKTYSGDIVIVNGKVVSGNSYNEIQQEKGNHHITTSNRTLPSFNKIHIEGAIEAHFNPSGTPNAKVTTDSNLQNKIQTEVKNGVLYVRPVGSCSSDKPIHVDISGSQISEIMLSGSSTLEASNINTPKLSLDVSGASRLDIKGGVRTLNIVASGASNINASSLNAEVAVLEASGASNVSVNAKQSVSGDVSGAANLTIHGNPKSNKVDTSGGASLHHASLEHNNASHLYVMQTAFNDAANLTTAPTKAHQA